MDDPGDTAAWVLACVHSLQVQRALGPQALGANPQLGRGPSSAAWPQTPFPTVVFSRNHPSGPREVSFAVRQSWVHIPATTLCSLSSRAGLRFLVCEMGTMPTAILGVVHGSRETMQVQDQP